MIMQCGWSFVCPSNSRAIRRFIMIRTRIIWDLSAVGGTRLGDTGAHNKGNGCLLHGFYVFQLLEHLPYSVHTVLPSGIRPKSRVE